MTLNRVLLIHGYIENPTIFDALLPLLPPAAYIGINLADEFARWQPADRFNARALAQYLIEQYSITADDVLIGHSMGGWTAINIKQLTGATVVQLSSWTNQKKILFPTHNLTILKLFLRLGITQSRTLTNLLKKQYPFPESRGLLRQLVDESRQMSPLYIWQQLQTLFAPVPPLTVQPDLRIHARPDSIVAPPDESFVEVPGDHFSLVFHADRVAQPIRTLLAKRSANPAGGPQDPGSG